MSAFYFLNYHLKFTSLGLPLSSVTRVCSHELHFNESIEWIPYVIAACFLNYLPVGIILIAAVCSS